MFMLLLNSMIDEALISNFLLVSFSISCSVFVTSNFGFNPPFWLIPIVKMRFYPLYYVTTWAFVLTTFSVLAEATKSSVPIVRKNLDIETKNPSKNANLNIAKREAGEGEAAEQAESAAASDWKYEYYCPPGKIKLCCLGEMRPTFDRQGYYGTECDYCKARFVIFP